jgi:immunity protein 27 of polymorphic toxin system
MKPTPHETELIGHWLVENGRAGSDAICNRIEWLTTHHFRKIAGGGWETLFQDPDDARYWERTYSQSEMHGGGPPALKCISREEAQNKYGVT